MKSFLPVQPYAVLVAQVESCGSSCGSAAMPNSMLCILPASKPLGQTVCVDVQVDLLKHAVLTAIAAAQGKTVTL